MDDLLIAIGVVGLLLATLFIDNELEDHAKIQTLNERVEHLESEKRTLIAEYEAKVDSLDRRSIDNVFLAWTLITESSRPSEWPFLAWSIRNRVDMGYRGDSTYQSVVLEDRQYSFYNHPYQVRELIETGPHTNSELFQKALNVAQNVRQAPPESSITQATHFFSRQSMAHNRVPYWWSDLKEVDTPIEDNRFRFMRN